MGFLLLEEPNERKSLLIKLLAEYLNTNYSIDEIHFLLETIIQNTLKLDEGLFNKNFINIISNFNEKYINHYNNLPKEEIDIDPSNYILKEEFHEGIKKLYQNLTK